MVVEVPDLPIFVYSEEYRKWMRPASLKLWDDIEQAMRQHCTHMKKGTAKGNMHHKFRRTVERG